MQARAIGVDIGADLGFVEGVDFFEGLVEEGLRALLLFEVFFDFLEGVGWIAGGYFEKLILGLVLCVFGNFSEVLEIIIQF